MDDLSTRVRRASKSRKNGRALALLLLGAATTVAAGEYGPSRCGQNSRPPFGRQTDATPRPCGTTVPRHYSPRHATFAHEVLQLESEACFVPDESFRLLDDIIDGTKKRLATIDAGKITREDALAISRVIDEQLAARNFGIYVPTLTLSDALAYRNHGGEPERHVIDCDTASFIYLGVAEALGLHANLVDIVLPSEFGHNYVRWTTADGRQVDWDTNGREECVTPAGRAAFEGKTMSREQALGYAIGIRGDLRERLGDFNAAVKDFRHSNELYSDSPRSANNLAWMVATNSFAGRDALLEEALSESKRATQVLRTANHLDTLACAYAANGDFTSAVATASEVVSMESTEIYRQRLEQLRMQKDCTDAASMVDGAGGIRSGR